MSPPTTSSPKILSTHLHLPFKHPPPPMLLTLANLRAIYAISRTVCRSLPERFVSAATVGRIPPAALPLALVSPLAAYLRSLRSGEEWEGRSSAPSLLRVGHCSGPTPSAGGGARPQRRTHPFYIAPLTEYPALLGAAVGLLLVATVDYLHSGSFGERGLWALLLVAATAALWVADLERMGNSVTTYGAAVEANLVWGFLLFVASEVMAFFGLFWGYLHDALNPAPVLGGVWPPAGLPVLLWSQWPTLSTALLVFSGFAANAFLYALKALSPRRLLRGGPRLGARRGPWSPLPTGVTATAATLLGASPRHPERAYGLGPRLWRVYGGLVFALVSGLLFLACQRHEYGHAAYAMADGGYGTLFYALTGLHGLHVMAGLGLLALTLGRLWASVFLADSVPHVGPLAAVWYWHFVDVVWILLYLLVYVWGSAAPEAPLPTLPAGLALLPVALLPYSNPSTPQTPHALAAGTAGRWMDRRAPARALGTQSAGPGPAECPGPPHPAAAAGG
jgi:heme/copper-type cytochrome/quinol oxidase subunit 3